MGHRTITREEADNKIIKLLDKLTELNEGAAKYKHYPVIARAFHHETLRIETEIIQLERRLGIHHHEE